jgi:hypothetical protein
MFDVIPHIQHRLSLLDSIGAFLLFCVVPGFNSPLLIVLLFLRDIDDPLNPLLSIHLMEYNNRIITSTTFWVPDSLFQDKS